MTASSDWLARFLAPRHAVHEYATMRWQGCGEADTPAEDAVCRIHLACAAGRITAAAFSVYGPPVVVACADWACEWLTGRPLDQARTLTPADFEQALALAPQARYAGLLVVDALAKALANLE